MRGKKPRELEADLDMTTFINLMVVLLAFLLVTAVFTEVTQLNVNLPSSGPGSAADDSKKPPVVLEVLLYKDKIIVNDQLTGPLKVLPVGPTGHDYRGLKEFLIALKEQYPGITEISLLLETDTQYDVLINSMDAVRYKAKQVNGKFIHSALFPDISIGSAPPQADFSGAAPAGGTP